MICSRILSQTVTIVNNVIDNPHRKVSSVDVAIFFCYVVLTCSETFVRHQGEECLPRVFAADGMADNDRGELTAPVLNINMLEF